MPLSLTKWRIGGAAFGRLWPLKFSKISRFERPLLEKAAGLNSICDVRVSPKADISVNGESLNTRSKLSSALALTAGLKIDESAEPAMSGWTLWQ
jgi:hypothetical protein